MNATQSKRMDELLRAVETSFGVTGNARLKSVMQSIVRSLHALVREVQPTHEEWMQALQFLTAVGQKCDQDRQEFILLSDVLGLSTLIELVNQPGAPATEGTVLGPYHKSASPRLANGASLVINEDGGEQVTVSGTVRGIDGAPIPGASIDVWSCASNGLYPAQDPSQDPANLRGVLSTDAQGRFWFDTLCPINYSVPTDGPVGDLLAATGRSTQRAAHVHLIVAAPGHTTVVTHVFDRACPYLGSDAVFSVSQPLVRDFERQQDSRRVSFDVVLAPLAGTGATK